MHSNNPSALPTPPDGISTQPIGPPPVFSQWGSESEEEERSTTPEPPVPITPPPRFEDDEEDEDEDEEVEPLPPPPPEITQKFTRAELLFVPLSSRHACRLPHGFVSHINAQEVEKKQKRWAGRFEFVPLSPEEDAADGDSSDSSDSSDSIELPPPPPPPEENRASFEFS